MALLEVEQISRYFEGVRAVDGVSLVVNEGEFLSIIGPNGAGKTTLFNLITGTDQPTQGAIRFDGRSLVGLRPDQFAGRGIARTFQHGRVFGNLSVLDNVLVGAHTRRKASRPRNLALELAGALVRSREARAEEAQLQAEAEAIIARFGERLTPRLHEAASSLSYANRRRLELARALALHPRLLLLDEPTAGMASEQVPELMQIIERIRTDGRKTIVMVEHNMNVVMGSSDRITVMHQGRVLAEGDPRQIAADKTVQAVYLGELYDLPKGESA